MTIANNSGLPAIGDIREIFERTSMEIGFYLTVEDRIGIERQLRRQDTEQTQNRQLLDRLLRYKLRFSRGAPEPVPSEIVTVGRRVIYMINDKKERVGTLAMSPAPVPELILVHSLLGATLIGMRALQEAPLLREDGLIDTVVVLDVLSPSGGPASDWMVDSLPRRQRNV